MSKIMMNYRANTFIYLFISSLCAFQLVVANDAEKKDGNEFVVKSIFDVFGYFAVMPWQEQETMKEEWAIFDQHGASKGGLFSSEHVIKTFQELPLERKKKGIFIVNSVTHLRDVDKSKKDMNPTLLENYNDIKWLKTKQEYIADFVKACDKAGIPLWVNINLKGKDITFIKLTKK